MKTILVLTDFSENAQSAAEGGLILAGKLHADLLLFNTYINYQTIASYGGGGWVVDEYTERKHKSRIGLQALTEGLESLSNGLDAEGYIPGINSESDDCDLGIDVAGLINKKNVELVVMGARSGTKDDFMFGADTNAVIEYSNRPVLIVPAGTKLKNLSTIVFATNFEEADLKAIRYMAKLGELLHYKLEIIHVFDPDKNNWDEKEQEFDKQLADIKYSGMQYHKVTGKDIVGRLNSFVNHTPGTILAMVHVQNSFLIRLFRHSRVKEALANQKTPLLIFPSKME